MEVYTEQWQSLDFAYEGYTITPISFYRYSGIDWAVKTLWTLLTDWKERHFVREVRKHIVGKHFDALLCTTFSTFPLGAAAQIAGELGVPLIADIRDIDEQAPDSQYQAHRQWWARPLRGWYRRTSIRRRNKAISKAKQVITVSPWHVEFLRAINPQTTLVYNGYDSEAFYPTPVVSPTFDIVYTGRIYESVLQDPRCFFKGLSMLPELPELRVVWYTNSEGQERIKAYAERHRIRCTMVYHDYVNPSQVPQILNKSSIVLVFSHPAGEHGPHGIMTTKFYEALGVEKPILCAPSDEECLEQVIHQTNAGIAARTPEEVAAFIQDKYHEWQAEGYTHQAVNRDQRKLFTRQQQAEEIETLIEKVIHPTISVIVPIYNAANYLRKCLDSLIEQNTTAQLQMILIDDGSTDDSRSIAQEYANNYAGNTSRHVILLNQEHSGQSAARNLGMKYAIGQYTCFVDADDYIDKDFLDTHLRAIFASGAQVVQSGYKRVTKEETILETKIPHHRYQFTVPWGRLYHTDILRDVHFPEGMIYEDVIFSLQLWGKKTIESRIDYIGYNYRQNNTSTTAQVNHEAQRIVYKAIMHTNSPRWLQWYTLIRLWLHFRK